MKEDKALEAFQTAQRDDHVVHISEATTRDGEYTTPYPIGYPIIDESMLGGVREGDLVVITGLSGQGKTTFFQNISVNLSKQKFSCLWFSYEVVVDNLYAKFKQMGATENLLIYTPKHLASGNLEWIQRKIREGIDKYQIKFIFIDHIDFLTPKHAKSTDQLRMMLQSVCTELKSMALEFKVVVFLVAHVKKVQGRMVEMQDISESAKIYQIADTIFCVERYANVQKQGSAKDQFDRVSRIRVLKIRITGERPMMEFYLEDNIIKALDIAPPEEDIEVTN